MQGLQEIVGSLTILLLFSFFLELLLPNNSFRGYLRVVVGLFIIITLLAPAMELFNQKIDLRLPVNAEISNNQLQKIIIDGKKLEEEQQKKASSIAKEHLERQIEGMISFVYRIVSPKVELTLEGKDPQKQEINEVKVMLNLEKQNFFPEQIDPIERVTVNSDDAYKNEERKTQNIHADDLIEQIRTGIGAYLNVDPTKIHILIQNF